VTDSLKNLCLAEWSEEDGRPCVLERWHEADFHRTEDGYEWRVPLKASFPEPVEVPPVRSVQGGYVLEPAHPTAGEPDWKTEAAAQAEQIAGMLAEIRHLTSGWTPLSVREREAKLVEVTAQRDAALNKIVSTTEAVENTRLQTMHEAIDIVRKVRDEWAEDGESTAGLSAAIARLTLAQTKV
jgi:hypothetical protein